MAATAISEPMTMSGPSGPGKDLRTIVEGISACVVGYDYKMTLKLCIGATDALKEMDDECLLADDKSLPIPSIPGVADVRSIHMKREEVLSFVVDALVYSLKSSTFLSIKPNDANLGHLVVLSQYQWPKYLETFLLCVAAIKKPLEQMPTGKSAQTQVHRFVYPQFMDFVLLPDILEEFMALSMDDRLTLEIRIPQAASVKSSGKSMTTRGVNKEAKEEVRASLVTQMKRSKMVIDDDTIIEFILSLRTMLSDLAC